MKTKVNPEHYERFLDTFKEMLDIYGLAEDHEISPPAGALIRELERKVFEIANGTVRGPVVERKKFIQIFLKRFEEFSGWEYNRVINSAECRMIDAAVDRLTTNSSTSDEYLKWFFEDYLNRKEMEKIRPGCIKIVCGSISIEKYLYENKTELKKKREESLYVAQIQDLMGRVRVLMRSGESDSLEWAKKFREGSMSMEEFGMRITTAEKKLEKPKENS